MKISDFPPRGGLAEEARKQKIKGKSPCLISKDLRSLSNVPSRLAGSGFLIIKIPARGTIRAGISGGASIGYGSVATDMRTN